mmetsp:Transcript_26291/g.25909  ORF Transcript_26291/g.25909 Transcript_26291/m.25909 type:complete len:100 (+) Transcript_26291:148-447(+)
MDKSKSGFFIAVIGCSQVGKTALFERLVKDMFIEEHQPTMTEEIQTTSTQGSKRTRGPKTKKIPFSITRGSSGTSGRKSLLTCLEGLITPSRTTFTAHS